MKNYTYVKDENGKITSLSVNGKPVMKSYLNALIKAQTCSYWKPVEYNSIASNPFSGELVELNPLETAVYTFVKKWERLYNQAADAGIFPIQKLTEAPVSTFDNMRYLFSALNSEAYYALLD